MKKRLRKLMAQAQQLAERTVEYCCKHPVQVVGLILLSLLVFGAIIKLLLWIISLLNQAVTAVIAFFDRYFVIFLTVGLFIWWCMDRFSKKRQEDDERERIKREQERAWQTQEYERTKEATYQAGADVLFTISSVLQNLGIVPPRLKSDLFSPKRTISIEDGAFTYCQYLLQKSGENVDLPLIQATMQTKIDQALAANEITGVPIQHNYDGRFYSGFVVDAVRDSLGFVEIYAVFVNDAYCRWKQRQELNRITPPPVPDSRDIYY